MPSHNLGSCSICGHTFKLVASGLVTRHGGKKKGNECVGSMKLPSHITPSSAPICPTNIFNFDLNASSLNGVHSRTNDEQMNKIRILEQYLTNNKNITSCKFIPKAARALVRHKLSSLLKSVTEDPDNRDLWIDVFAFPLSVLYVDKRKKATNTSSNNKNYTNVIKNRIEAFRGIESLPNIIQQDVGVKYKKSVLANCVKGKMEQGNMKAAVRLLADEHSIAPFSEQTIESLKEKHPLGITPSDMPPAIVNSLVINANDVIAAINSFPAGSAGGLDGFRPQHLKDLINKNLDSDDFVDILVKFINVIYKGKVCPEIKNIFFGGNITALIKKTGDIRPITVGIVLRRLASKCANNYAVKKLEHVLAPRQLGVGVKGGAEAAIHSARIYLKNLGSNQAFIKLDFSNAFNCLYRQNMLMQVYEQLNELYNYCCLNYLEPIMLNYQGTNIISSRGVQQGDPLGPLLFAITIHSFLVKVKSEFVSGYLDDISLGDDQKVLCEDYTFIKESATNCGLSLNENKSEYISADPNNRPACFRNFKGLKTGEAELLGSAVLKGDAQTNILNKKHEALKSIIKNLSLVDAHDALVILRFCLSTPRIVFLLRSSPCRGHPLLAQIDSTLEDSLSEITNVRLDGEAWLQASLPIRAGGLGIRSATSLAAPAFIASFFGTRDLSLAMLPERLHNFQDEDLDDYLSSWSFNYGLFPNPNKFVLQKTWDSPYVEETYNSILSCAIDSTNRARLRAVRAPYAGAWLQAWPLSSCGLRLSNPELRVSVALRLGAKICHQHKCHCGAQVEDNGIHGLSCRRSLGRHHRHSRLNEIIDKSLTRINVPCIREPTGLSVVEGLRPDGVTVIPWKQGKCLAWDVTVPDTLAPSHVLSTSEIVGSAAHSAATNKNKKYISLLNNYCFVPVAVETLGAFDTNSLQFLKTLGSKLSDKAKDRLEMQYLMQKISCAIQKGNFISISETNISIADAHFL